MGITDVCGVFIRNNRPPNGPWQNKSAVLNLGDYQNKGFSDFKPAKDFMIYFNVKKMKNNHKIT